MDRCQGDSNGEEKGGEGREIILILMNSPAFLLINRSLMETLYYNKEGPNP